MRRQTDEDEETERAEKNAHKPRSRKLMKKNPRSDETQKMKMRAAGAHAFKEAGGQSAEKTRGSAVHTVKDFHSV
ncbi:Hypothetical predicted protein [Scomber scombrus]|uniref:Uncharacterized protein n=1 Tax=Scomber scombrus TaxID=13677 RepID=A0AAV1NSZ9_SCOSC